MIIPIADFALVSVNTCTNALSRLYEHLNLEPSSLVNLHKDKRGLLIATGKIYKKKTHPIKKYSLVPKSLTR